MRIKSTMILIVCLTSISLSSCFVTRFDVGSNEYVTGKKDYKVFTTYSQIKKEYLFFGLWSLNPHLQPTAPADGNYTVQSSFDIFDGIIAFFTDGVFGMRTVKILVQPKQVTVLPPNK
jgi:hypothetical protein